MPTYEYECGFCNHRFEKSQSITKGPIRKCPKCGKFKIRRLIGAGAGFLFKGSGFYQTDYRSENYKKKAEAEKPKTESKSSDSKPKSDSSASAKKPGG